ncbi:MAG: hypothetical protein KC635_17800, partial [Myxococcales bacterium]|nr:hypothetical protein [Myxococcales bacterium]
MRPAAALAALVATALAAPACLDPLVSDEVAVGAHVLPAGSVIPPVSDAPEIARQIAENDGVGEVVPLLSGFAKGAPARFWDFGPAPNAVAPIYVVVAPAEGGEYVAADGSTYDKVLGSKSIVGTVPGDPAYSPFWQVFLVVVTDAWDGEVLASIDAIEEAQQLGLVKAPLRTFDVINCPIVSSTARLEQLGSGGVTQKKPSTGYYEGYLVDYFFFDHVPVDRFDDDPPLAFVLRREGGEPLSEPARGVDMTGDGDLRDTNDVFAATASSSGYTGLVRVVDVVVPADYASIDTSQDETVADVMHAATLFRFGAIGGDYDSATVVAAYPRADVVMNWPLAA